MGGAGLEDDLNDLRLEEENEQPPLILETDWITDGCTHQSEGSSGAAMNMWHKGGRIGDGGGFKMLKPFKSLSVSLSVRLSVHTHV